MKKIKAILKNRTKEKALRVKEYLEKKEVDVYRTSKYGVYFRIDAYKLNEIFKCELENDLDHVRTFKIPDEIADELLAIYEPSKPIHFK